MQKPYKLRETTLDLKHVIAYNVIEVEKSDVFLWWVKKWKETRLQIILSWKGGIVEWFSSDNENDMKELNAFIQAMQDLSDSYGKRSK